MDAQISSDPIDTFDFTDQQFDDELGKRLRRRRRLLDITQQQLGAMIGVRFQQIQKYECGSNNISYERLLELTDALKTDLHYMLGFMDGVGSPRDAFKMAVRGEELKSHVGSQYRAVRRAFSKTQQDVASAIGVRFQQVQKYESGANKASIINMIKMGRAHGLSNGVIVDMMAAIGRGEKLMETMFETVYIPVRHEAAGVLLRHRLGGQ